MKALTSWSLLSGNFDERGPNPRPNEGAPKAARECKVVSGAMVSPAVPAPNQETKPRREMDFMRNFSFFEFRGADPAPAPRRDPGGLEGGTEQIGRWGLFPDDSSTAW